MSVLLQRWLLLFIVNREYLKKLSSKPKVGLNSLHCKACLLILGFNSIILVARIISLIKQHFHIVNKRKNNFPGISSSSYGFQSKQSALDHKNNNYPLPSFHYFANQALHLALVLYLTHTAIILPTFVSKRIFEVTLSPRKCLGFNSQY